MLVWQRQVVPGAFAARRGVLCMSCAAKVPLAHYEGPHCDGAESLRKRHACGRSVAPNV